MNDVLAPAGRQLTAPAITTVSLNLDNHAALCRRLLAIDFFGKAPPEPPWSNPTLKNVTKAIENARPKLPFVFKTGYADPLLNRLRSAIDSLGAEPVAAPIYEHADDSQVRPQLNRFLAVISDMYRSFLSKAKRHAADVPLRGQLPPLAFFQNDGQQGPYTIPSDDTSNAFGSDIGIVSLPATYQNHPFLWASLAHETGGHDVLHADSGLLDELAADVRTMFGGGPIQAGQELNAGQFQGLLWSHWIDETAADVYGILNIGPQFAMNLAVFFPALLGRGLQDARQPLGTFPFLRTDSGINPDRSPFLDEHPTDILRLHIAIGVVESLSGLAPATRNSYVAALQSLAGVCAAGATTVRLTGLIRLPGIPVPVQLEGKEFLLSDMQEAARRVGGRIATSTLRSLGGHGIQEIETWDDGDESTAQNISRTLLAGNSIVELGDDAQLLAGATLALYAQPDLYDKVSASLNEALDSSFGHDPIWGPPQSDRMIVLGPFSVSASKGRHKRRKAGK